MPCSRLTTDNQPPATTRIHVRTACAWSETTDCRIFSCQRSIGGGPCTPPNAFDRALRVHSGHPELVEGWGPTAPLRSVALMSQPLSRRYDQTQPASVDSSLACQPKPARRFGSPPSRVALRRTTFADLRRAKVGGEYRARTGDLLVANQALSQLS